MTITRALILAIALLALSAPAASGNGCPSPCSGQTASPPDMKLLYVQRKGSRGPVAAYNTANGRLMFVLRAGVTSANGQWHYSLRYAKERTVVTRYAVATGRTDNVFLVPRRWQLAGASPTGQWLALTAISRDSTRIAIVNGMNSKVVHSATLAGKFEVETISADGKRLFLIQHLDARRYLVRLYDVHRARLKTQALRASGEGAPMVGYAWNGIGSPDGSWLLTLYLNTRHNHAFVHALNLDRSEAACLDLPSGNGSLDLLKGYTLTLSPNGKTLYAANPALGVVAAIDLRTLKTTRVARFEVSKHVRTSRAMLAGTISRNGRTLYFSDGRDLWAYDTAYGIVRGAYGTGGVVVGFGYGKGDRRVHALRADGRMVTFNAATGKRVR